MKKGQLSIISLMFGLFLFLSAVLILFSFAGSVITSSTIEINNEKMGEVRALEFANIILTKLSDENGEVRRENIESVKNLGDIGLVEKYASIEDFDTGEVFIFTGQNGQFSHKTYFSIVSDYIIAKDPDEVIMKAGREYVIHYYTVGSRSNRAVDIYQEPVCIDYNLHNGFFPLDCDKLEKTIAEKGIEDMTGNKLSNFIDSTAPFIQKVVPKSTIRLSEVSLSGKSFGKPSECLSTDDKVCIRLIGKHSSPASLYVEIDKYDNMVSD